jgi:hypothetical protein
MNNQVVVLESKRFVVRKSLIGKNTIVNVTFKNGTVAKYNHDAVYEVMKEKLNAMNCWEKYKSYTSSVSMPVATRSLLLTK